MSSTKYPDHYTDVIKPRLTDTQRDICDVVIRIAHRNNDSMAVISNSMFALKASKSVQGIIKAKKQLEAMGLLVVLSKGGGSEAARRRLDTLWTFITMTRRNLCTQFLHALAALNGKRHISTLWKPLRSGW